MNYQISEEDVEFIRQTCHQVLENIPVRAFNCAMLSAILGAIIYDNSKIPVAVIAGHLDYNDQKIFYCKGPIPYSRKKKSINEIWDGHCWVELGGLVIDISIFRTVYFGQVPGDFHDQITRKFGLNRGALVGLPGELAHDGFNYTPCYCLTQDQITGLVQGART
ncbi:MAG: hypothetical protein WC699_16035 [Bacteroidales bacterium]